jgi:hypothetical protein
MTEFYDSATWPEQPPSDSFGVKYADGDYESYQGRVAFLHRRLITVHGHYRSCQIIDPERGNWAAYPWTLTRFIRGRQGIGQQATTYSDRADIRGHLEVLGWRGEPWPDVVGHDSPLWAYTDWWVATLDDRQWSPDDLATELAANWQAPIPASRLWANQWTQIAGGAIDQSTLFGAW